MDRKAYKLPFREEGILNWECPTCGKGKLQIQEDSFKSKETTESKRSHSHSEWDPDWIESVYSCLLECNNPSCKDTVSNSGIGFIDVDYAYDEDGIPFPDWTAFYTPRYFSPHLNLFLYPKGTPEEVADEINKSFSLFFCDPASSANHIRRSVEALLTNLKVKRFEIISGKKRFISLHRRINFLPQKHDSLKELLLAVKWLGNAGSHSHKVVTEDDVLDAYEIMEEILNQLFKKGGDVRKLAKEINKKKGPKGKKKAKK